MSLSLGSSIRSLAKVRHSTAWKSPKRLRNTRGYSEQPKGPEADPFKDLLSSVPSNRQKASLDPRTIADASSKRKRTWYLGLAAAAGAVAYTVYTSDYYSQRQLRQFTPESLDEDSPEMTHAQLRGICAMILKYPSIEGDLMSSPAYSALRKAVYSKDKYVRLLALRSLAALARNSREIRKRIAQTMDFPRLSSEIFVDESVKRALKQDGAYGSALLNKYFRLTSADLEKELTVTDLDHLLVYAFDDIVSSTVFHIDSHPKLLPMRYAEHAAEMVHSPCHHVRVTGIRAVSGLTRTVEGRQALARTDVFPVLYNLIYGEEKRDKLFQSETINFAIYAMQQLLLSESALDIMLPRYEKFFLGMTQDAKEELLMKFDLQDDSEYARGLVVAKQAVVGFGAGVIWGTLRSLLHSEWVAGQRRPQVRLNSLRNILIGAANGSTGALPLIALYILLTQTNQSFLAHYQDSRATHTLGAVGLTATFGAVAGLSLQIFPFAILPAFVGVLAPQILTFVPGSTEQKQSEARLALQGTPDSDLP